MGATCATTPRVASETNPGHGGPILPKHRRLAPGDVLHDACERRFEIVEVGRTGVTIDHAEFGVREWNWHALATLGVRQGSGL